MLVDVHAHLQMPEFDSDRAEVIARAAQAGVKLIVTAGTDLGSSRVAVAIAEAHPLVLAAVGVHPNELEGWSAAATIASLRALAQHPRVAAIGEIGLDRYRMRSPLGRQISAFRAQLELAADLGLPVVVHDREAHEEVLSQLCSWALPGRNRERTATGVLHAFSGDTEMARQVVDLGLYVSVAGPVTYPRSERAREVCRQVPLERLLLETDSPYLAPQPKRGRRNEPAYVEFIAREVAAIRGIDADALGATTSENALRLFGRPIKVKDGEE